MHKSIRRVNVTEFLNETFDEPVYVQLPCQDYNKRTDNEAFSLSDFFKDPTPYESTFLRFTKVADMFIACHYWNSKSPFLFTREEAKLKDFRIKVVGDISCDVDGPVACTIRASTIEEPLYGYHPDTESEVAFNNQDAITVMAVDNLPTELPRDSSTDFGNNLLLGMLKSLRLKFYIPIAYMILKIVLIFLNVTFLFI